MLAFRKILLMYLMDGPLIDTSPQDHIFFLYNDDRRYSTIAKKTIQRIINSTLAAKTLALTLSFPIFFLIPLKSSENLLFSNVFREIKREHWEEKV